MKKVFKISSSLLYLEEVVRISEYILSDEEFLNEVSKVKKFSSTNLKGVDVVLSISIGPVATVSSYKTLNPWSSVTAYTTGKMIKFNTRNNPRSINSMVNTLIHEYMHVLGFHHSGNSSKGNQESIPYMVGDISETYVTKYL